jgi:hypothetical protein
MSVNVRSAVFSFEIKYVCQCIFSVFPFLVCLLDDHNRLCNIQSVSKRLGQTHSMWSGGWDERSSYECRSANDLWASVCVFTKVMIINSYRSCSKWLQSAWMHVSALRISDWLALRTIQALREYLQESFKSSPKFFLGLYSLAFVNLFFYMPQQK